MPVPQIMQLQGTIPELLQKNSEMLEGLKKVNYSSRYALGLFYDKNVDLGLPYAAKYVTDDPIMRFIAVDNEKRSLKDAPTSVVFHTSIPFGIKHVEKTPKEVQPILEAKVKEMFPDWPEPAAVKCQKWRYSQVSESYPGAPGCLVMNEGPLLIAGGDAFTHSNFDGCVASAEQIIKELKSRL